MERTKDDFDLMRLVMVSVSVTVLWGFVLAARTKSSMWWLVGLGLYWLIVAFSTENWDVDSWASNPVPSSVLVCADVSLSGFVVGTLFRYLGVYLKSSVKFKCSFAKNKDGFYKAFDNIFGKIGRNASEEVLFALIKSKCLPTAVLFHGTEACPISSADKHSLEFTMNKVLYKIFGAMSKDCYMVKFVNSLVLIR